MGESRVQLLSLIDKFPYDVWGVCGIKKRNINWISLECEKVKLGVYFVKEVFEKFLVRVLDDNRTIRWMILE